MKKSSGKEEPGRSLEDVFREGFSDAESAPSSKLWENLDRELENQELKRYKRHAFWYRSVAAACILVLLTVGGFFWKNNTGQVLPPQPDVVANSGSNNALRDEVSINEEKISADVKPTATNSGATPPVFGQFFEKQAKNSKVAERNASTRLLAKGEVNKHPSTRQVNSSGESAAERLVSTSPANEADYPLVGQSLLTDDKTSDQTIARKPVPDNTLAVLNAKAETTTMLDSAATPEVPTILLQRPKEALAAVEVKEKKEKESASVPSKWSLAVAYAPQYAYAPIKANSGGGADYYYSPDMSNAPSQNMAYQAAINEYDQTYEPAYSYRASVGVSYSLNEKWYLESGLAYAENRETTQHSYIVNSGSMGQSFNGMRSNLLPVLFSSESDRSSGSTELVTRTAPYTTHYSYQQVGILVKVGFRHYFNKLFAYAASGFNANLLLKNNIEPESNQLHAQHYSFNDADSPFNPWQISSVTSAGLGYVISDKLTVSLAPEVTYALTPFFKNAQYQKNNLQMGVSIEGKWRIIK